MRKRRDSIADMRNYIREFPHDPATVEWVVLQAGRIPYGPTDIAKGEVPSSEFPLDWIGDECLE